MKFEVLNDSLWAMELKRARGVENGITAQIKMKLHSENPTPGFESIKPMLKFERDNTYTSPTFSVECGEVYVGTILSSLDGTFYFHSSLNRVVLSQDILKELYMKLEQLNTKVGSHQFTD